MMRIEGPTFLVLMPARPVLFYADYMLYMPEEGRLEFYTGEHLTAVVQEWDAWTKTQGNDSGQPETEKLVAVAH